MVNRDKEYHTCFISPYVWGGMLKHYFEYKYNLFVGCVKVFCLVRVPADQKTMLVIVK